MTERNPADHTAVSWHSVIAQDFDDSYRTNRNFRERFQVWSSWIAQYAKPDFNAADLGCGSGVFTLCLSATCRHVTAVDGSTEMIKLCQEKVTQKAITNITFVQSDIVEAGKTFAGQFDLVTCSSVIEYLEHLDDAITAMSTMVKPEGLLIISSPNRRSFFRKIEPYLHKYIGRPRYYRFVRNVLTREDMTARLNKNGFEILEHRFYAQTRALSFMFRKIGLREYSDNMFAFVCRKKA